MKIKIEIKNRFTGKVIFEFETENNTVAKTINEYVKQSSPKYANLESANLKSANLKSANLKYANLEFANLKFANLEFANLESANLESANLKFANLKYANLKFANLKYANLESANLKSANLEFANLEYANLESANLKSANLKSANLKSVKADFFMILLNAKHEVAGLKEALINGKINGSAYEGECACLVGTIANIKKCDYASIPGILPDCNRPAERWFLAFKEGVMPENNPIAKITLEWIEEFETLINN